MPEVLKIDPLNPDNRLIAKAVHILTGGGVIAYPTETFYGLGADAYNAKAIERIFLIKGREGKNPLSVIIGDLDNLGDLVHEIPEDSRFLMEKFWPGALTIVFTASQNVPSCLTAGTGKIGIRISSHPIATALAKTFRHPITATSANPSGAGECISADEVIACLGDKIDAVIDGGLTLGGAGSTIIDITAHTAVLLREGAIPSSLIFDASEKG